MKNNPVIVRWIDITSWNGWNGDIVDSNLDEPAEFFTLGFVVRKTKSKLSISDTYPEIGTLTVFPMGVVKSIEKIDAKKIGKRNTSSSKRHR